MIEINDHVQERAMERYGIFLDSRDIDEIRRRIQQGEAEFMKFVGDHEIGKVSAWKLRWEDIWIYPLTVFESKCTILTFYTKKMVKQKK